MISTKQLLIRIAEEAGARLPRTREALQAYGEKLDRDTGGLWVTNGVLADMDGEPEPSLVVIDAVRVHAQVEALRQAWGRQVTHVHLKAPDPELERRYEVRRSDSEIEELSTYAAVKQNPTEAAVDLLAGDADVLIDTSRCRPDDVEVRCAARLSLLTSRLGPYVDVLIGGQYGSEGKGNVAYYLAPEYDLLVRVGGPNAGHKVPLTTPYTHRQLPSGTRANAESMLLIGPGATLNVELLLEEISDCNVDAGRLIVDPRAMVIEADDVAAEVVLKSAIGSTGQGGGAAAARRIRGRHGSIQPPVRLARDIADLRPYTGAMASDVLAHAFNSGKRILLEGTQGTSLSLYHGSYPHVTARDTTVAGCLAEAGIAPAWVRKVLGIFRTYPIRVGGQSGPMGEEIDWEAVSQRSGVPLTELMGVEKGSVSGNRRRVAEFDWVQLRASCQLNGITDVALSFADYLDVANRKARRFDQLTQATVRFVQEVESVAEVPVSLIVTRFDVRSVIDRRRW